MKIIVILTLLSVLIIPQMSFASGDEVIVTCKKEGSEMYLFSFRKALEHKEFCGPIDEPRVGHALASEIVKTKGVYRVVSVEEYEFMLIKGTDFSVEEIGAGLRPIIAKYLKVKKVTIIYK
jgi:hypothetical protein